jgi:hypothetical protein
LTNLGDPLLERLSFVFDGGVGFQGGVCGALAGAIMGINLSLGCNIRDNTIFRTIKEFSIGHINLLKNKPIGKPEPFGAGKNILQKFKQEAGAIECSEISEKSFSGWNDFQQYINSSGKCSTLIELSIREASSVINSLNER